ncbi:MAG: hypothetical protein ACRYGO_01685 [Janthinobacterium lividum]
MTLQQSPSDAAPGGDVPRTRFSLARLDIGIALVLVLGGLLVAEARGPEALAMDGDRDRIAHCREEQGRLWATPERARAQALACQGLEDDFRGKYHRSPR